MSRSFWLGFLLLAAIDPGLRAQEFDGAEILPLGPPGVTRLPPVGPVYAESGAALADALVETPPGAAAPVVEEFAVELDEPEKSPWEGSVEIGVNGTTGNTETFNFHSGFDVKRTTDEDLLTADLDYRKTTDDGEETANRAFLDWRWELLRGESRVTSFVHGTVDYDEFQAFDVRVAWDIGYAVKLIKTERTTLTGRFGGGGSREIGGPDDRYVPEAVFGGDFQHRLSKRQKLNASVEYAPDVQYFRRFRLNSQANWEVVLDEAMNLSMKVGLLDRYDSTPHGAKPNDFDYSVVLLWGF